MKKSLNTHFKLVKSFYDAAVIPYNDSPKISDIDELYNQLIDQAKTFKNNHTDAHLPNVLTDLVHLQRTLIQIILKNGLHYHFNEAFNMIHNSEYNQMLGNSRFAYKLPNLGTADELFEDPEPASNKNNLTPNNPVLLSAECAKVYELLKNYYDNGGFSCKINHFLAVINNELLHHDYILIMDELQNARLINYNLKGEFIYFNFLV